jgi:hypothetical protein
MTKRKMNDVEVGNTYRFSWHKQFFTANVLLKLNGKIDEYHNHEGPHDNLIKDLKENPEVYRCNQTLNGNVLLCKINSSIDVPARETADFSVPENTLILISPNCIE